MLSFLTLQDRGAIFWIFRLKRAKRLSVKQRCFLKRKASSQNRSGTKQAGLRRQREVNQGAWDGA